MHFSNVLLIDDSPVFLDIARAFIEHDAAGRLRVVGSALSAEEGLRLAAQHHPDAVTVDLRLPGMSGLNLIPRLRLALPDAVIVALTEHTEDAFRVAALAAGADDFIAKPDLAVKLIPALSARMKTSSV
jgi:DNA-binding NarL/FixJ family response regulator